MAVLYLAFAAFMALSWHYNALERLIPDWMARQIYPIDKTNLDILRFVALPGHCLAGPAGGAAEMPVSSSGAFS